MYAFTVGIGSGFAYIAAYFFDFAIQLSLNGSAYALNFVSQGWTTARDIANMAFLFILLYIAFIIMFRAETGGTLSMLAAVIVVALLVNFSFFFTRLVIDAGNILSIQFYNAITAPSIGTTASAAGVNIPSTVAAGVNGASNAVGAGGWANTKDLTASIMGMLNVQGLFNTTAFNTWYNGPSGTNTGTGSQGFLVTLISLSFLYIAAGIMLWLLTVAFVANGIKFLFRIVVLWFLIIASPLAFIARAIPSDSVKRYYYQWQSLLIQHAFYPAVFMFIFLMLTNFANQMACAGSTTSAGLTTCAQGSLLSGLFSTPTAGTAASPVAAMGFAIANIAIRLGFVIAILYIGLEASKAVGVMGASWAESAGNWFGGKYVGLMSAGVGFAGQQTIGRGANALGNSAAFNRTVDAAERRGGLVDRTLWRGVSRAVKGPTGQGGLANASFDVRQAPVLSKVLDKANAGKPSIEGGFAAQQKAKADQLLKAHKERAAIIRDAETKKSLERVISAVKSGKSVDQKDKDFVKSLTKGDAERAKEKGTDLEPIVPFMSEGLIKAIKDSDKFTDTEKAKYDTKWQEEAAGAPNQKANEIIKKLADIDTDLKATRASGVSNISISALNPTGGNNSITKVNTTIDEKKMQDALKEVESEIDELKSKIDILPRTEATKSQRIDMNHQLTALQNAKTRIDELKKVGGNIPKIGNRRSGEILVK